MAADAAPGLDPDEAARRRRHIRVLVSVAALALVVAAAIGVITGQALDNNDMDPATSEEIAADNPVRTGEPAATLAAPKVAGTATAAPVTSAPMLRQRVDTPGPAPRVRADRLRADLVAVQRSTTGEPSYDHATLAAPKDFVCADGNYGDGLLVGVLYDDMPALVAFRDPVGSTQVADVLACGTADLIHSMTLRVR